MCSDITLNMDNDRVTALLFLDLSTVLISLSLLYGVSGVALHWLKPYLSVRRLRGNICDCFHHHLIFYVVFLRV